MTGDPIVLIVTITPTAEHPAEAYADDVRFVLTETAAGTIGDPDQHELYGATVTVDLAAL